MRYGTGSTRPRHNDRGNPSSNNSSQESLRALAKRQASTRRPFPSGRRGSTADLPTGPKDPNSTSLSLEDEATIVAFRKHTLLPLDDCLYALQPTIPHLTRSSLYLIQHSPPP